MGKFLQNAKKMQNKKNFNKFLKSALVNKGGKGAQAMPRGRVAR